MIVAAILFAAALPADVDAAARRIAVAKVQPPRAIADALTQFDRQFEAGYARSSGSPVNAVQRRRLARMRAAGRSELSRQLATDAIPRLIALTERDYRDHYTAEERARLAAFWTSPAGAALTRAIPQASRQGGALTLPEPHRAAIVAHLTSSAGRKEAARSATLQNAMARTMTAFFQRAQPKVSARIAAASATPVAR